MKQAVGGAKQKSEILAIPNRYKDTLDDFIDSSDLEHPEMLRLNSQRQRNSMLETMTILLSDKKNIEKNGGWRVTRLANGVEMVG